MAQDGVGELGLTRFKAIFFDLFRHQIALGDLDLLFFCITREVDDFHAVHEGTGNIAEDVGRRDPEDFRQVEGQFQEMVTESIVLFRVEDFQQCRRRVAAHVGRHLVDFVEEEDRVLDAGLFHTGQDTARQGTDVSPAMAADFSFIADAAQGYADVLAVHGPGDGFGDTRLARARRTDKTENRPFQAVRQLFDR